MLAFILLLRVVDFGFQFQTIRVSSALYTTSLLHEHACAHPYYIISVSSRRRSNGVDPQTESVVSLR